MERMIFSSSCGLLAAHGHYCFRASGCRIRQAEATDPGSYCCNPGGERERVAAEDDRGAGENGKLAAASELDDGSAISGYDAVAGDEILALGQRLRDSTPSQFDMAFYAEHDSAGRAMRQ